MTTAFDQKAAEGKSSHRLSCIAKIMMTKKHKMKSVLLGFLSALNPKPLKKIEAIS